MKECSCCSTSSPTLECFCRYVVLSPWIDLKFFNDIYYWSLFTYLLYVCLPQWSALLVPVCIFWQIVHFLIARVNVYDLLRYFGWSQSQLWWHLQMGTLEGYWTLRNGTITFIRDPRKHPVYSFWKYFHMSLWPFFSFPLQYFWGLQAFSFNKSQITSCFMGYFYRVMYKKITPGQCVCH